jgi:hypothetical protein
MRQSIVAAVARMHDPSSLQQQWQQTYSKWQSENQVPPLEQLPKMHNLMPWLST